MIMKPYGVHKLSGFCQCSQCGVPKNLKGPKKSERQKAKKEIRDEVSKVGTKSDVRDRNP